MQRNQFLKLCLLSGVAVATGVSTGDASSLPADLDEAMKLAGLTDIKPSLDSGILKIDAHVADLNAFANKAGRLGDGKVRAIRNTLAFERNGQMVELSFTA